MNQPITLKQVLNRLADSDFETSYISLLVGDIRSLDEKDLVHLLKVGVVFLNYGDPHLQRLGYRIIMRYSTLYDDYRPLFDVAINKGFIPVSKFIERKNLIDETSDSKFFNALFSAFQDNFRRDQSQVYLSFGQKNLHDFSTENDGNFVVVAPTSYGKSEIIVDRIYANTGKKICVIVPSKALLAQTKRRIVEHFGFADLVQRVITHPEMYKGSEASFVAVLTQERLLRLLQRNPGLSLDLVLIDVAHNLLKDDSRAVLLSQVLMILKKRKTEVAFNFFTPFISESNNHVIPYAPYEITTGRTDEFIKIERFYSYDILGDQKLYLYDQFLNQHLELESGRYDSDEQLIVAQKSRKNIVYLNRPRDIEKFALRLRRTNRIGTSSELREVLDAISDFVHPDYYLLSCIQSGIVYHHGGMPEIVRLYVENIFSTISELQFIITSSTLLEGVNIPAEKIFLLTTGVGRRTFSRSQFKNLIGRVCRFSEVFNPESGTLKMLEPQIYVVKGEFARANSRPDRFLQANARIDLKTKDIVENVLLENDPSQLSREDAQTLKSSLEYLENIEPNTVQVEQNDFHYVESEIAKLCYANNIYDFDIRSSEDILKSNLSEYVESFSTQISTPMEMMEAIYEIFIKDVPIADENMDRFSHDAARRFYAMFLDWRTNGSSYRQMIGSFTSYWRRQRNQVVFMGQKWGEVAFNDSAHKKHYVDLSTKSESQKTNLAIVRIKEEQDFVDNNLIKYVEILNDLELVEKRFYEKIKYGSSDQRIICLLKNGFSMELAKIVVDPIYSQFVRIDATEDLIRIDRAIVAEMEENEENKILVFEIKYHIG